MPRGSPRSRRSTATRLGSLSDAADAGDRRFYPDRFQEEARNKKPIGIQWLQAAAVALFSTPGSTAIWRYRLPSALAATMALLFTSMLGATLLSSRRTALLPSWSKRISPRTMRHSSPPLL